jgi:hypothetical protein
MSQRIVIGVLIDAPDEARLEVRTTAFMLGLPARRWINQASDVWNGRLCPLNELLPR